MILVSKSIGAIAKNGHIMYGYVYQFGNNVMYATMENIIAHSDMVYFGTCTFHQNKYLQRGGRPRIRILLSVDSPRNQFCQII